MYFEYDFQVLRVIFAFNTHLYCFFGCFSVIVWTHAVMGVLYTNACFVCIFTCSVQLSMFHMERCSRNTFIIITLLLQRQHVSGESRGAL